MTLEAAMKAAAARGCKAFTVWPCAKGWQASVRAKDDGWTMGMHPTDPAQALAAALGWLPQPGTASKTEVVQTEKPEPNGLLD